MPPNPLIELLDPTVSESCRSIRLLLEVPPNPAKPQEPKRLVFDTFKQTDLQQSVWVRE